MRSQEPVARGNRHRHIEHRLEILPHIELAILAADEDRDQAFTLRLGLGGLLDAGQARGILFRIGCVGRLGRRRLVGPRGLLGFRGFDLRRFGFCRFRLGGFNSFNLGRLWLGDLGSRLDLCLSRGRGVVGGGGLRRLDLAGYDLGRLVV